MNATRNTGVRRDPWRNAKGWYIGDKHGGDGGGSESESESGNRSETRAHKEISEIPLRGWESVLNTCFPYRIHFEPQSTVASNADVTFVVTARSSFTASPNASWGRENTEGGRGGGIDLFRSSIILFYFPRRFRSRLPFDLSLSTRRRRFIFIYDPTPPGDEIHRLFHRPPSTHPPRSLVPPLTRPAVCDFISFRRNHRRRLSLAASSLIKKKLPGKAIWRA